MKSAIANQTPTSVPETAKQVGEAQEKWNWVERTLWTERMLTALATGPAGGKWYSLIDKVIDPRVLKAAFAAVAKNRGSAGIDHVGVKEFRERLDREIPELVKKLRDGTYEPQKIRRVRIPKPGSKEKRPLGIPTIRDRVVQKACVFALEPIFETAFAATSFGFRPGKSAHDALDRVVGQLKAGHVWVVDADLKGYFDSIPHERLLERVGERISDGRLLELIRGFMKAGVLEDGETIQPEGGTPQGGVVSPLLANIYLDELDHLMVSRGFEMTRYADDLVVMCRTAEGASSALEAIREWVAKVGLVLHPTKTRIVNMAEPRSYFDFLGYRYVRNWRDSNKIYEFVRPKSLAAFRDRVRMFSKRLNGASLKEIIENLNRGMRGWFEYFYRVHAHMLRDLDQWVRGRLRRILAHRRGRKGFGRGLDDHRRWSNSFFDKLGLFSLAAAQVEMGQSS